MKLTSMQQLSVLACCTGLLLAVLYAVAFYNGAPSKEVVAMLVAAVGGFELFLFSQERSRKARRG